MNRDELDNIINKVNQTISIKNYDCIEAEWVGSDKTLRLFIEKTSQDSINIDDCVEVNRELNNKGIIEDLINGSYTLEVSSPGINKPLRTKQHFMSNLGELIKVKKKDKKSLTGRLLSINDNNEIILETDLGFSKVLLDDLSKANILYKWEDN